MTQIISKLFELSEKSKLAKRNFITKYTSLSGVVISKKNQTHVWFESGLEKDFSLLMEYHPSVNHYTEQPITIEYQIDDKTRIYTPDFLVHFGPDDIKPWLCEIKYREDLKINFSKYKPRFRAAIEYCKGEGWEFRLLTEMDIRTPLLENLKFLHKYDYEYLDANSYHLVLDRVKELGITTPRELFLTLEDEKFDFRGKCIYSLWYAIKISDIECDYSERLTLDSEIWIKL